MRVCDQLGRTIPQRVRLPSALQRPFTVAAAGWCDGLFSVRIARDPFHAFLATWQTLSLAHLS